MIIYYINTKHIDPKKKYKKHDLPYISDYILRRYYSGIIPTFYIIEKSRKPLMVSFVKSIKEFKKLVGIKIVKRKLNVH